VEGSHFKRKKEKHIFSRYQPAKKIRKVEDIMKPKKKPREKMHKKLPCHSGTPEKKNNDTKK